MLSTVPFEVPARLMDKARAAPRLTMAVAGAGHPLAMESARRAAEAGLIEPVLIGDADASSKPGEEVPEMAAEEKGVSFHHKRLGQRSAIVLGGPAANFILAIFILVMWRLLSQDARSGVPSALPWLAFLASPGLVFFFHIVGSLDYVAFIAVWALILASSRIGSTAT